MTQPDVRSAITPLRLVFWGGLICVFDFSINGFDLVNDVVGALMIAIGVYRLADIQVHDRYAAVMQFVRVVAILNAVDALRLQVGIDLPAALGFALLVFAVVCLATIVAFCVAMRWFCEEASLLFAARSWQTTTVLFVVIYLVPLGLFYLACCVAILSGESFNVDLGVWGVLLLPVFVAPLVHLFVSTSRMTRANIGPDWQVEGE